MKIMKKSLAIVNIILALSICTSYSATSGADAATWLDDPIAKAGASIASIDPILDKLHNDFFKPDKTTVKDDLFEADKITIKQKTDDDLNELIELIDNADI